MHPLSTDSHEPPALDFLPMQDPANMRAFAQEADGLLQLRFDMSTVQSAMRLADPIALELEYTRMMMRCLLFNPEPQSMLMLGLGGGSLVKYCHHTFPQLDITAVEINPHVIALRERFQVPADGPRLRVLQADGAAYVLEQAADVAQATQNGKASATQQKPTRPTHDAILVDAFHFDGPAQGINSRAFFRACRTLLSKRGVMVVNLESDPAQCQPVLEKISQAFDGAVWSVPVGSTSNRIAFAASKEHLMSTMRQADARLAALAPVHQETLTQRVGKRLAFAPLFG